MRPSEFKIISASAGSGKTFAVTKAYLKIILTDRNNDAFKHILAITFTNKAVGEMKERIIDTLKAFAAKDIFEKEHPMFQIISKETGLSKEYIHQRSNTLLVHILHNYGGFEISTIDSFIHRIIRTFARDLSLPSNFEVELDQDDMLSKAVDHLISEANQNEEITKVLVDFALEKSDEDKSFDISYDLRNIAKVLISERDHSHIIQLETRSLEDFKQWKSLIKKRIDDLENKIQLIATNLLSSFSSKGLETTDFIRGLGTYFVKLSKGESVSYDTAWQEKLESGEDLHLKKVSETKKESILEIQSQIVTAFKTSKSLVLDLWLEKALYKNLVPLSILKSLQSALNKLKTEDQKILISEFNTLIKNEIKNQPTPYIFERLGEKIKHYFVDEFQDTSVMQWHNLIPLFDNSLSGENGSATIVGDTKQAIYRWRGGDASQLTDLTGGRSNPFAVPAIDETLEYNFRSCRTIVEFNNGFFHYLSGFAFRDETHQEVFKKASQEIINKDEGFIDFQFIEAATELERDEYYGNSVKTSIENCLARGYTYQNICVLVRKHKHGVAMASYLGLNKIPVTSSEALLIKNSPKIQLLLKLLELQINPEDEQLKVSFLYDLADLRQIVTRHDFITTFQQASIGSVLSTVFLNEDLNWLEDNDSMPLYDMVESYIQLFGFDKNSDAFIQFFLDLVLEHTLKRDGGISSFIDYFYENEDKLSISSPENRNAVSIMTIHKAKGLEFPIVIFPYADINIYEDRNSHLWVPIDAKSNMGFEEAMLSVTSKMKYYKDKSEDLYETHLANLELDHINLLYVAMTRPINELYLICKKDIKKNQPNLKSFAGLFISYLQHLGKWSELEDHYSFGSKSNNKDDKKDLLTKPLSLVSFPRKNDHFKIITRSGLLWDSKQAESIEKGNIIHQLLSYIKTIDDVPFALNQMTLEGIIQTSDVPLFKDLLLKIVNHPKLETYFTHEYEVFNETDLIGPENQILRPDRLCIKEGTATIIDYKTGSVNSAHKSQIESYKSFIEDAGYTNKKGFLVYINDTIEVVEV